MNLRGNVYKPITHVIITTIFSKACHNLFELYIFLQVPQKNTEEKLKNEKTPAMLDTKQVKEPKRTEEERRKKINKETIVISSSETNSDSFLPLSKSVKMENPKGLYQVYVKDIQVFNQQERLLVS